MCDTAAAQAAVLIGYVKDAAEERQFRAIGTVKNLFRDKTESILSFMEPYNAGKLSYTYSMLLQLQRKCRF